MLTVHKQNHLAINSHEWQNTSGILFVSQFFGEISTFGVPGMPPCLYELPPHHSCTDHHSTDGLWASRLHTPRRGRSPSSSSGNWANIIKCHAGVYPSSSRKNDNRTCPLCSIIIRTYIHVYIYR